MSQKNSADKAVRDIPRKTRRKFSAEEKIRIVLEGLRGEESIASLCRCRCERPRAGEHLAGAARRTGPPQLGIQRRKSHASTSRRWLATIRGLVLRALSARESDLAPGG